MAGFQKFSPSDKRLPSMLTNIEADGQSLTYGHLSDEKGGFVMSICLIAGSAIFLAFNLGFSFYDSNAHHISRVC
jgi:hypothetical protein